MVFIVKKQYHPKRIKICALGALYHGDKPTFFIECLDSLRSQTLKLPLVIVIDGSIPRELEEILILYEDLNIRLIRNTENLGLSAALQKALNIIEGEYDYVIRFDSDDINDPKRFQLIVNYLISNDVDLLSSHMHEIDENGNIFSKRDVPIGQKNIQRKFPYRNPINHPASAFKLAAVMSVGGYKEMPFFEDWYLWTRMHKAGYKICNIDDYLVSFRATNEMVARRFGWAYIKHETNFFYRRGCEKLINPFENWLSYTIRLLTKIFGFKIYKKIFFLIRK